jgi:hypothetical protein
MFISPGIEAAHFTHSVPKAALNGVEGFSLGFGDGPESHAFQEMKDDDASLGFRKRVQGSIHNVQIRCSRRGRIREYGSRVLGLPGSDGYGGTASSLEDIPNSIDDAGKQIAFKTSPYFQGTSGAGERNEDVMDGVLGNRSIRSHG